MINIQLTYHGHPIYQICFLNTVMPVALTLTIYLYTNIKAAPITLIETAKSTFIIFNSLTPIFTLEQKTVHRAIYMHSILLFF